MLAKLFTAFHDGALGARCHLGAMADRLPLMAPVDTDAPGTSMFDTFGHTSGHTPMPVEQGKGPILTGPEVAAGGCPVTFRLGPRP